MSQSYILPSELEKLLLNPSEQSSFLVIDVRSSDFVGGNIPNALNLTTDKFSDSSKIERVIEKYVSPKVEKEGLKLIIVHCMRSQTRGPYVAHLLSQSPALPKGVQVRILKGGFQGWYRLYKGRKEMFENLEGEEGSQDWEDVVEADEGDKEEAEDSRQLRKKLGRE
ncbi:hypothetical protein JCM5350_001831 [Sporobolomyces pararoseus]